MGSLVFLIYFFYLVLFINKYTKEYIIISTVEYKY